MRIEARLEVLGLVLPAPMPRPPTPGLQLPFPTVREHGKRVFVSGHGPQQADGTLAGPFGKVDIDVTPEQATESARLVALSMLGSLKRQLGDLDRISAWLRVFGMVNSGPDFTQQPAIINGFTLLILEVFGAEVGAHARSAISVASLPFNLPVELEAELEIDGGI